MRKLILQVQISIDGYIGGLSGEMDWMEWNWGEDINSYVGNISKDADTIILGRKLAEGFIPYWDNAAKGEETVPGAEKLSNTPKVVFSHTLTSHQWPNTTLATGDLTKEINSLKAQNGADIIAYGGAGFVTALIENDLIDEYFLLVNPTAIGKGLPIFSGKKQLKLAETKAFNCGIVALHYTKN